MDLIGEILGTPLGYVMKLCYDIFKDYGMAIIVFTLLTKVILFPVSLLVQKNSVKMIKMKPQLDQLNISTLMTRMLFWTLKVSFTKRKNTVPLRA
jgi:YidC/Oxa1 family membrane protein insertase